MVTYTPSIHSDYLISIQRQLAMNFIIIIAFIADESNNDDEEEAGQEEEGVEGGHFELVTEDANVANHGHGLHLHHGAPG